MNTEEIKAIKAELKEKYNINSDRDLIKQLGIEDEDKSKLFLWIRYQCAFSKREGYEQGQDDLKYNVVKKLTIPDVSENKLYTEQEVKKIINILVINERNITYSISQGRNSVKRFLIDFNNGKY